MKRIINCWCTSWAYLTSDDLVSYFSFTTIALAEIAFMWAFNQVIALPFTFIIGGCILNLFISSILCGYVLGEESIIRIILYWITYLGLFIFGCTINLVTTIVLFLILFGATFLWMQIHEFQICEFEESFPKLTLKISNLFHNKFFYFFSLFFIIGIPIIIATIFFALTNASVILKITLPIVYILLCPFIAYFEDSCATMNVFELGGFPMF